MKTIILLVAITTICYSQLNAQPYSKNVFKVLIEAQAKGEQSLIEDYQLAFQKDSSQFQDKNHQLSNTKLLIWTSKKVFKEQKDINDEMSRRTLSNSEYLHYQKMNFSIDTTSDQDVSTLKDSVTYDKEWILNFFIQSELIFHSHLSSNEYSYYLLRSKIEKNPTPDYIEKLISASVHSNDTAYSLALVFSRIYLTYFVLMHEFYHSYYDTFPVQDTHRELSADSFAISKCIRLSGTIKDILSVDIFEDMLSSIIKKDKENFGANHIGTCINHTEIKGINVTFSDYLVSRIANIFSNFLLMRDMNLMLTNTDFLRSDIERSIQLNAISQIFFRCNADSNNLFCCFLNNELSTIKNLKNRIAKISFSDYYQIKISKDTFIQLSPENPSFISFQLGNYYVNIGDFAKAVEYYESANLFDKSTYTTVLCNLLCGDIYKSNNFIKDIDRSNKYYQKARALNQIIPVLRDEIINGN